MVNIEFYKYNGDPKNLNKVLGEPVKLSGFLPVGFYVNNPVLKVSAAGLLPYNYLYIAELKRFYFVTSQRVAGNYNELFLNCDVLNTFKNDILAASVLVTESENENKYLSNRKSVFIVKPNIKTVNFTDDVFNDDGSIIMLTLKGKINN